MNIARATYKRPQQGAAMVEFALVAALFFMIVLGAMEMARLLWTWNAAAEATRLGARLAVVCDVNDATITTRMQEMLPYLQPSNVTITYLPNSCTALTCLSVRVTLAGYEHVPILPFVPLSIPIQTFQTTLPREYMNSAGNPVCG